MSEYIGRRVDKVLEEWDKGDKKALMIFGARQIGKTYSIRHFIREKYGLSEDDNIIEINTESLKDSVNKVIEQWNESEGISLIKKIIAEANLPPFSDDIKIIFIDELQALSTDKKNIADAKIVDIIQKILKDDEFRYIFSGSLLGSKISDIDKISSKIRNVASYHMFPICFEEFLNHVGDNNLIIEFKKEILNSNQISESIHIPLLKRFVEYSFTGGIPASLLEYFKSRSISDAMNAIVSLEKTYNQDITKYFREEFSTNVDDVFSLLMEGFRFNDKKTFMNKKFNLPPLKQLYRYTVDSDVGLLVPHIDEINKNLNEQEKPKTYFFDIGFLRARIIRIIEQHKNDEEFFKKIEFLKSPYDINEQYKKFCSWIDGDLEAKQHYHGVFFEQLIAQELKANSVEFSYLYEKISNSEKEIEFICTNENMAIDVKSGGTNTFDSLQKYSNSGNKSFLLSMLPYICEYTQNLYLMPIYAFSILSVDDIKKIKFKSSNEEINNVIKSGRLPLTPGFYFKRM